MADQAGFTRLPNDIIEAMPCLGNAELRTLLAIARKTIGFQKESDRISVSQIAKMTGLTPRNTQSAITSLLDKGLIERSPANKQGYTYSIKTISLGDMVENHIPTDTISLGDTAPYPVGTRLEPKPYPLGITQKKDLKEKERKGDRAGANAPRTPRKKADKPTASIGIIKALARACQIDRELAPKKTHILLAQTASKLQASGQKRQQTEQQIIDTIAYVASYFAKEDWRGKKGEPPTPSTLLEVWPRAIEARSLPIVNPGANIPVIRAPENPEPRKIRTQEEIDRLVFEATGKYPKLRLPNA